MQFQMSHRSSQGADYDKFGVMDQRIKSESAGRLTTVELVLYRGGNSLLGTIGGK